MKAKTKFFGEIDIDDEQIILFPFGIYGFEEYTRFVLLHDEEDETGIFRWLQSVDEEFLCFTVMEPNMICGNYSPELPKNALRRLGADDGGTVDGEDLIYVVITVICDEIENSTVNLLSPIIINSRNKVAAQVILESYEPRNSGYKTKHRIFDFDLNADADIESGGQEGGFAECLS
jgi:flagellar assembly factor FliW